MQLTDTIPGTPNRTVGDALRAALRAEQELGQLSTMEARRGQQRAERTQRLNQRIAAVANAVDDLPEGATKQQVKSLLEEMLAAQHADDAALTS